MRRATKRNSHFKEKVIQMSKFEEKIAAILKAEKIAYVREKTFVQLRGGHLRFDFYLPGRGICIECDGAQHFHQIKRFQATRAELLLQKENDRRKNSYCLANEISLYRIPYWREDSIKSSADIFRDENLVKSIWHNDNLIEP